MAGLFREVVREHHFERDLRALIADTSEGAGYVEGAEFWLARGPFFGFPTDHPKVWFLPMAPISGRPVALYYTFDEATIWFFALERRS